jgi:hypothetical protein
MNERSWVFQIFQPIQQMFLPELAQRGRSDWMRHWLRRSGLDLPTLRAGLHEVGLGERRFLERVAGMVFPADLHRQRKKEIEKREKVASANNSSRASRSKPGDEAGEGRRINVPSLIHA